MLVAIISFNSNCKMNHPSASKAMIGIVSPPGILKVPGLLACCASLNLMVAKTTPVYSKSKVADTITANCLNPPEIATAKAIIEKVMMAFAGVEKRG